MGVRHNHTSPALAGVQMAHKPMRGKKNKRGGQGQQLHVQQSCPGESSEGKGQSSKTAITIIHVPAISGASTHASESKLPQLAN